MSVDNFSIKILVRYKEVTAAAAAQHGIKLAFYDKDEEGQFWAVAKAKDALSLYHFGRAEMRAEIEHLKLNFNINS